MKQTLYKITNSFFKICNQIILFSTKYPLLIIALLVVIVASIVLLMVKNDLNVGGVIGQLLNQLRGTKEKSNIEVANSIPENRKQALEEADGRGYVQHKVSELETSINPFRDKSVIGLPDGRQIKLPSGVKDTDIDVVIVADQTIQIIPNKENYQKVKETQQVIQDAQQVNNKAKDILIKLREKQNV